MASKADEGSKAPRERISAKSTADPILRNALRYTISAKEYETLHKYIISRSKVLKRNAPTVAKVEKLVERPGRDDYNAAAVRDSLRVFMATSAGLKAWAVISERLLGGERIRYVSCQLNGDLMLMCGLLQWEENPDMAECESSIVALPFHDSSTA